LVLGSGPFWGRRPRRPAGALQDADVVVPAAGRGRPGPEGTPTRGSAPPTGFLRHCPPPAYCRFPLPSSLSIPATVRFNLASHALRLASVFCAASTAGRRLVSS